MAKKKKTVRFKDVEELKEGLKKQEGKAQAELDNYKSLILNSLGPMPKNQVELLAFVERVMKYHEVI